MSVSKAAEAVVEISQSTDRPSANTAAKRVMLIAPQPFFENRGTPINVKAMACALSELGYLVDLFVYPLGDSVDISGVRLERCWAWPRVRKVRIGPSWTKVGLDISMFSHALINSFTRKYDIVHGVEEGAMMAGLIAKIRGLPFVFDMDSVMSEQLKESRFVSSPLLLSAFRKIEGFFIKEANAVLTVCRALTERAQQEKLKGRVWQIEDFPIESSFGAPAELREKIAAEICFAQGPKLLYTGNFEEYQGICLLLESFAKLCFMAENRTEEQCPQLVLVGGGDKVASVRNRARELGVESRTVFVGNRPSEEMGAFMELADVLVSPRIEGKNTPLKLYSYMAAQKPIVATRIYSHTQLLDEDSAFLADPNACAFSKGLARAIDSSEDGKRKIDSVVQSAKSLIDKHYNKREFTRRLGEMYADLI